MKSSFIAASIVALGTFAHARDAEDTRRIEASVEITATRVTARNHGQDRQVLLFRNGAHGRVLARSLPPAGELVFDFPRHALAGVELELVSLHGRDLVNSGIVPIGDAFAGGTDTVWFQHTSDGPFVWLERDGSFTHYVPSGTLVPPVVVDRGKKLERYPGLKNNAASNAHVPVVTPRDKPDEYGPPELEEQPLPPV